MIRNPECCKLGGLGKRGKLERWGLSLFLVKKRQRSEGPGILPGSRCRHVWWDNGLWGWGVANWRVIDRHLNNTYQTSEAESHMYGQLMFIMLPG